MLRGGFGLVLVLPCDNWQVGVVSLFPRHLLHVFSCVWGECVLKGGEGAFGMSYILFLSLSLFTLFFVLFLWPFVFTLCIQTFFRGRWGILYSLILWVYVCVGCVWVWFLREYIQGFCTTPSWAGQRRKYLLLKFFERLIQGTTSYYTLSFFILVKSISKYHDRPYHPYRTRSHPNSEVKLDRAEIVIV